MNRPNTLLTRTPAWAVAAASALALLALSGCTAGSDEPTDALDNVGDGKAGPTLYMNVTANGQTHRFSSADLPGHSGHTGGDAGGANATATSSSGTVTAQGNATAGNGTAQGNGTASNGTATGGAGAGNSTGGSGVPGLPSGDAPLNVTVELGASGLPDEAKSPVNWTVRWGDAGYAMGSNSSAGAGGNGTAARQQLEETGSSLPARLSHQYSAAGRHQLSFAVEAAGQAVDTLHTFVVVSEGVPSIAPGTPLGQVPFNATGSLPISAPSLGGCPEEGGEEFPWMFLDKLNGTPAQVSEVHLVLESSNSVYDAAIHLYAPNGTLVGSADTMGEADETLDLNGTFEPGDYVVHVVGCGSAGGDIDLEGFATYVAAGGNKTKAT
jgi:hypothetical protein